MAVGLRLFTERAGDGAGVPVLDSNAGEELIHVQPGVSVVLANRPPEQVLWLSDVDRAKGYAVDFLSVSLHAISRDPEAYPSPCIYAQIILLDLRWRVKLLKRKGWSLKFCHRCSKIQRFKYHVNVGDVTNKLCLQIRVHDIDTGDEDGDQSEGSDTEDNGTVLLSKVTEMRLVPSDSNQLDTLFEIFCKCAEMNPEPVEGEEGHNWIFSADQMQDEGTEGEEPNWHFFQDPTNTIGHSNGDHDLAHSVLEQLEINDERFEDAEEMEGDHNSGHP
ncbi:hypothetical protein RHSIM_Rhsim03G0170700 [Rhododendron simsii]|uniref:Chloride conductance regulatory protein ICln n=1 Tax=Rhododendron simsii TaxID=118357 RepID=A0A834LPM8_RHOSS|nr:hypothetical protein RHSIM_Rhsim03G0170700 [Rhododendron simsii]